MVITKDLSRLGRDYIETGNYLEKYFPTNKVRFIAINDGYDSLDDGYANEFAPFKSVFNDMYAKDISKKVRTALKTKQIKGEFIGTTAPFGYIKDEKVKGRLLPDSISAEYVKKIFNLYLARHTVIIHCKRIDTATYTNTIRIPKNKQYTEVFKRCMEWKKY